MMRVLKVEGEATRFHCESNSVQCVNPQCNKLFSKLSRAELHAGHKCPHCGIGTLDLRFHLVDIVEHEGNGSCSCEYFQFAMRPKLSGMLPAERAMGKCRCTHIKAVRDFALDLAIKLHDIEQHKDARGQREENQP